MPSGVGLFVCPPSRRAALARECGSLLVGNPFPNLTTEGHLQERLRLTIGTQGLEIAPPRAANWPTHLNRENAVSLQSVPPIEVHSG